MGFGKWLSFGGGREETSSAFGFSSTAEEVTQGIDAGSLTAIVTGTCKLCYPVLICFSTPRLSIDKT